MKEHYLLASAYIERYSPEADKLNETFSQMHNRFSECSYEQLNKVWAEAIPDISKKYTINAERLTTFFEDTFGLYY